MTFQFFRAGRASGSRTAAPAATLTVHCKSGFSMDLTKPAAPGCVRLSKRRVRTSPELFCRGKDSHTAMRGRSGTSTGCKGSVELRKDCTAKVTHTAHITTAMALCAPSNSPVPAEAHWTWFWVVQKDIFANAWHKTVEKKLVVSHPTCQIAALTPLFCECESEEISTFNRLN